MSEDVPKSRFIKPQDLPLYKSESSKVPEVEPSPKTNNILMNVISSVRSSIEDTSKNLAGYKEKVIHIIETGKAHTSSSLATLQDEENLVAQIGVIGVGGLIGYIFGAIRGKAFKKLIYTTIGFAGSASLCYPETSGAIREIIVEEGQNVGTIGINFIKQILDEDLPDTLKSVKKLIVSDSKENDDSKDK